MQQRKIGRTVIGVLQYPDGRLHLRAFRFATVCGAWPTSPGGCAAALQTQAWPEATMRTRRVDVFGPSSLHFNLIYHCTPTTRQNNAMHIL